FIQLSTPISKCSSEIGICQATFPANGLSGDVCEDAENQKNCILRDCAVTSYQPNVMCAEIENNLPKECDLCNGQTSLQKSGLTASVVIITSIIIRFFFADL
ncbi:hypothetical protein RRG08_004280, partial [Elysia crispata]